MQENNRRWKTIGVLGGMGPEATAEFYSRIIRILQSNYGVKYDSDFPPIFIYNLPLSDIVEESGNMESAIRMLKDGINKLEVAGCSFVAVPCNTVTYFTNEIKSKIPLLTTVQETYLEAKKRDIKKIGVLSTTNTARNCLYENIFTDIEILQPSEAEKNRINEIILRVLAGWKTQEDKEYLKLISRKLQRRGAEAVILGCTDISLLISQKDCDVEILDTVQILAESTVKLAEGDKNGLA